MIIRTISNRLLRTNLRSTFQAFKSTSTAEPNNQSEDPIDIPTQIIIPEYEPKLNEPLEQQRQRLRYQSRKRGMLENDLLLSTFANKYLKQMTAEQLKMYDTLINKPSNDWDIYYWAINKQPTPSEYDNEIMDMLKEHTKNKNKEILRMPELENKHVNY